MNDFIHQHNDDVIGTLSGFDRLRVRGTIRWLANRNGMGAFLHHVGVLLKDFRSYALSLTAQVGQAITAMAESAERPNIYLTSSSKSKEPIARQIAQEDGIAEGLICVLRCVEPCWTYKIRSNRQTKHIELNGFRGKCQHYYYYYMHPVFGFMHVRVQAWLPFTIHACLNGREWLARQMDRHHIGYVKRGNCFVDVEDFAAAQRLLNRHLRQDWVGLLDDLLPLAHPAHHEMFGDTLLRYYWSFDQSEWATDVLFGDHRRLAQLYRRLVHHGITALSSPDVLRFLGHKIPPHGRVHGLFTGEVSSTVKHRPEGVRIKHYVNGNSVKMYDKQGSVLRVETTINNVRDLKTYRPREGDPDGPKYWRKMRKGVSDVYRRAQVSQAANDRYLDTMACVSDGPSLGELTTKLCQPTRWKKRRVRALNPLASDDAQLLQAVNRGEFTLNGFRNRDLRALLFSVKPQSPDARRRQASAVTRKLRLLRAHGLIRKVPKTHRYILSAKGRQSITALLLAQQTNAAKLAAAA